MRSYRYLSVLVALAICALTACTAMAMQGERPRYNEYYPESLHSMPACAYYDNKAQIGLLRAAADGDTQTMQAAVKAGADVNGVGRDGMVPLYWSMAQGSLTGTKWLVEHGADPNKYTQMPKSKTWRPARESAMSLAVDLKNSDFLKVLLEHGGNADQVADDSGSTILFYAIVPRRPDNARLLVKYGADVNHQDGYGNTPLYATVTGGMFDIGLMLLRAGANPKKPPETSEHMLKALRKYGDSTHYKKSAEAYPEFIAELQKRGLVPKSFQYDLNHPRETW